MSVNTSSSGATNARLGRPLLAGAVEFLFGSVGRARHQPIFCKLVDEGEAFAFNRNRVPKISFADSLADGHQTVALCNPRPELCPGASQAVVGAEVKINSDNFLVEELVDDLLFIDPVARPDRHYRTSKKFARGSISPRSLAAPPIFRMKFPGKMKYHWRSVGTRATRCESEWGSGRGCSFVGRGVGNRDRRW